MSKDIKRLDHAGGGDDSWEKLAKDLFGIDMSKDADLGDLDVDPFVPVSHKPAEAAAPQPEPHVAAPEPLTPQPLEPEPFGREPHEPEPRAGESFAEPRAVEPFATEDVRELARSETSEPPAALEGAAGWSDEEDFGAGLGISIPRSEEPQRPKKPAPPPKPRPEPPRPRAERTPESRPAEPKPAEPRPAEPAAA